MAGSGRWSSGAASSTSRTAGAGGIRSMSRSSWSPIPSPEAWIERHPDAPFTFVTDGGVERAVEVASEIAGDDRTVGVAAGNVGSQVIDAGLADGLVIDLAPVVLGAGRPFFDGLESARPVRLSEPRVVQGTGAVHLVYDVQEHSAGETSPQG